MAKLVAVLVLCCLVGAFAAPSEKKPRIAGGIIASKGQFPHVVSFQQEDGTHICSGAIISETIIVTAAACVHSTDIVFAVAGTNNLLENGTVYDISKIVEHPDYNEDQRGNIAVVRLQTPIEFNENVQPIKVSQSKPAEKETLVLIGWGESHLLRHLKVESLDQETCLATYNEQFPWVVVDDSHMCTVSPEGDGPCFGDFGNPLINADGELVGLWMFTFVPCTTLFPELHTVVNFYKDWIAENSQ